MQYLNFKKCITLLDTVDLNDLVESVFSNCPVKLPSTYIFQYYDQDFDDFVDLDDLSILETIRKIKIIAVTNKLSSSDIEVSLQDADLNESTESIFDERIQTNKQTRSTSSDEQTQSTPSDEQTRSTPSDEQTRSTPDEQTRSAPSDEQTQSISIQPTR